MSEPRRVRVLNSWVETFDTASFLDTVAAGARRDRQTLIANHNVNSLTIFQKDERFRELFDVADHCFVDGMGVLAISKLEGTGLSSRNRIAVLDWIWPLFERAEQEGWRITHLGAKPSTIDAARAAILERYPKLALTTLDGYFDHGHDAAENRSRIAAVNESAPNVLLVGMGMPLQEHWLLENLEDLPRCVIITVGGILGFLGGERRTAPRWLGRLGLEWVFRVATEPRRLRRRYTVEPLALAPVIGHHLANRLRRGRAEG